MEKDFSLAESFPINQLEIDYQNLKLVNFDELMSKALSLKKTYTNLIITDEKELKGLRGRDSVLSNLRKIRNQIDTTRKEYNKEIKKRSAYPREQLVELTQVLDDTIDSLNVKINDFEQEEINNREKELANLFQEILEEGEKELIPENYESIFTFEMFYKERFTNKSNHVNKMTEKGKRKFIIEWFNLNVEAINKMKLVAERFEQGNDGFSLVEENIRKQIISLISQQLNTEEKSDPDKLKSDFFDWLNDQLDIYRQSVISQKEEAKKLAEQRQKLKEERKALEAEKKEAQNIQQIEGSDENGGIVIDSEEEQPQVNEKEYLFNITVQATERQIGAIKEELIRILGSNGKFMLDKINN